MQTKKNYVLAIALFSCIFPLSCYADYADYVGSDAYDNTPSADYSAENVSGNDNSNYSNSYSYRYSYSSTDTQPEENPSYNSHKKHSKYSSYSSRLPANISSPGEKLIVVDPRKHVWGAYSANGKLLRAGLATAGGAWCDDIGRPCRTSTGLYSISSLGDSDCVSNKYPIDEGGGAPMPYCMYFNGGQGIHGSYNVVEGNQSHGCVRVSVSDAKWIRYNFANIGTRVIIKPY